ncbi:MAG: hypothetical protein SPJ23_08805, partial [Eubacteriales bacterium]|nr:hypothetical protein [Eubacteriales bacterium]
SAVAVTAGGDGRFEQETKRTRTKRKTDKAILFMIFLVLNFDFTYSIMKLFRNCVQAKKLA